MEFVIDSSARNKRSYPSPCRFRYSISRLGRNISYIKLSGCVIPRSEPNVSSHNAEIPFNIDDKITAARVTETGFGYTPGTYISSDPNNYVQVSDPGIIGDGSGAEFNLTFSNSLLSGVEVTTHGSKLFDGVFLRTIESGDVGAEPGAQPATIRITVTDNKIQEVLIVDPGNDWTFGVDNYGSSTYNPDLVYQRGGHRAVVTIVVGQSTGIESIEINDPGSGYVIGNYLGKYASGCNVIINIPASPGLTITPGSVSITTGRLRTAVLREGQYAVESEHDGAPGLCREVTRALQKASSPEDFPYALMDSDTQVTSGSCSLISSNPNALLSKKIVIRRGETADTDGNGAFLEILFGTENSQASAGGLLGFGSTSTKNASDSICPLLTDYRMFREGVPLPDAKSLRYQDLRVVGSSIFNLNDTPNYLAIRLRGQADFQKFASESVGLDGATFIVAFKTGVDNVYSDEIDSGTRRLDILGKDTVTLTRPVALNELDIEIVKPNGDLYNTTRDLALVFEIGTVSPPGFN